MLMCARFRHPCVTVWLLAARLRVRRADTHGVGRHVERGTAADRTRKPATTTAPRRQHVASGRARFDRRQSPAHPPLQCVRQRPAGCERGAHCRIRRRQCNRPGHGPCFDVCRPALGDYRRGRRRGLRSIAVSADAARNARAHDALRKRAGRHHRPSGVAHDIVPAAGCRGCGDRSAERRADRALVRHQRDRSRCACWQRGDRRARQLHQRRPRLRHRPAQPVAGRARASAARPAPHR